MATAPIHSIALLALGMVCFGGPQNSQAFQGIAKPRLALADLDGDGRPEILAAGRLGPFQSVTGPFASRRARVEAYSRTGTVLRLVAACEDIHVADDVAAADLDADGRDEVLVIGAGRLSVLSLQGDRLQIRRVVDLPHEWTHRVDAADVDGDGRPEVVVVSYEIAADRGIGTSTLTLYTWTGAGLNTLEEVRIRGHVGDLAFSRDGGHGPLQLILERGGGEEGGEGIGYAVLGTRLVERWRARLVTRPVRVFHLSALPGSGLLLAAAVDGSTTYLRSGIDGPSLIRTERLAAPAAAVLLAYGDAGPLLILSAAGSRGFGPALAVVPLTP